MNRCIYLLFYGRRWLVDIDNSHNNLKRYVQKDVCIHINICIQFIYMYMDVYIYKYLNAYVYTSRHRQFPQQFKEVYMYIHINVCVYVYVCNRPMYIYTYICIYIHINIYIYKYILSLCRLCMCFF
jgi:hypothetical protein